MFPLSYSLLQAKNLPKKRGMLADDDNVEMYLPVSISATANRSLWSGFFLIPKTRCWYCLHITVYIKRRFIILGSTIRTSVVGVAAANIIIAIVTRCWGSTVTNSVFSWWLSEPHIYYNIMQPNIKQTKYKNMHKFHIKHYILGKCTVHDFSMRWSCG
jgi:hypothetical protein